MSYLKTTDRKRIFFTEEQLTFIKSFNREYDKGYNELLHGRFGFKQTPEMAQNEYEFYEFPKVDTEYLEYLGWKKSKKYKNSLEKSHFLIHLDKTSMHIEDERQLYDERCIYDGSIPNTEEFLILLKLLNIE